uniref:Cadherin domain-containing protein n=1 Tax=Acrobeloides nanus TaxID=290746 RepID=A0A914DDJ3_9BILA
RERQSEYRLQFLLQGEGSETLIDHPLHVELLDINDNAPVWNQSQFHILFNRTHSLSPRNVHRFIAKDYDSGENARIHYSLSDTNLFEIDSETGVLRATKDLPCINGSEIRFKVIATDYGAPPLSSTADVVVDVIEAYRKPPIFSKALYEITVREDAEIGTCLLQ